MTRARRVGRGARAALTSLGLLALVGCSSAAPVADTAPAPQLKVDPALVAQREAARIADCPETPASVRAVPGGLPDLLVGCLGSGRQVNLAGLRGRPMVLNIWAQWCGPCRLEAPSLTAFAARAGERVQVLGLDYSDPDPALALEFAASAGWTYPHLTDPSRRTAGPLGFGAIPVTLFVDAEGRVVGRHVGPVESADHLASLAAKYLGVAV